MIAMSAQTQKVLTSIDIGARQARQLEATGGQAAGRRRRKSLKMFLRYLRNHPVLMLGVAFPTAVIATYVLFIATPVFVSESKFVVRLSSPPSQSTLGAMLQSSGITRSQDDTFSVSDFLLSRDALRQLDRQQPLHEMFSAPGIDFIARYPRLWDSDSFEGLYRYYLARTDVVHNASTGITTLRTRAFSPQHAFNLNNQLLSAASDLLVRMNNRAREDAIAFSQREVTDAEHKLLDIQDNITKFRNNEMMIDPTRLSIVMLETIGRLSTEAALTRARRSEAEAAAPGGSALPNLTSRIAALEEQIDRERLKLVGKNTSVSTQIAEYERLVLMRELASKTLSLTTTSLENARADARRQQIYLETIVQPNLPDEATEPNGATNIAVTFLLGAVISLIAWILWMAAAEHSLNRKLLNRHGPAVD